VQEEELGPCRATGERRLAAGRGCREEQSGFFLPDFEGREKEGRLVLDSFRTAGIDLEKLAADLQSQGAKSFDESWQNLLAAVECKGKEMRHSS
jgi:hypothetical protein